MIIKNTRKKLESINYGGTDAYIIDAMYDRDLYPPMSADGKLNRKFAIRRLQEWEASHAIKDSRIVEVIFPESLHPSSGSYVFVSINGKTWQIPYNTAVQVPEYILKDCIDLAVTKKTMLAPADEDTMRTGIKKYIEVESKVYPYTVLRYIEDVEEAKPLAPVS